MNINPMNSNVISNHDQKTFNEKLIDLIRAELSPGDADMRISAHIIGQLAATMAGMADATAHGDADLATKILNDAYELSGELVASYRQMRVIQ